MKAHVARKSRQAAAAVLLFALLLGTAADAAVAATRPCPGRRARVVSPGSRKTRFARQPERPHRGQRRDRACSGPSPSARPTRRGFTRRRSTRASDRHRLGDGRQPGGDLYTISPYVYWAKNAGGGLPGQPVQG